MKSILLIQPKFPPSYWGQEIFVAMTPFAALYPPLGLLTLAALTPKTFEVDLCDENAGEEVNYETNSGIIGITGYVFQVERMVEIADEFRKRGKLVVIGGPAANLVPERLRDHCDVLFEGEAEYTWPRFLKDYEEKWYGDSYIETDKIHLPDSPMPRLDILKRRYAQGIVQCTRGCPFSCEFCDIIVMYGRKVRFKPIERILAEVQAWHCKGVGKVFFADDNFVGHRAYAKDLLRAVTTWNSKQRYPLSFYTQASVDMVRDEELLGLMRDANFFGVFLGIESPRKSSLAETHKTQNQTLDLVKAVHKIQSYNLFIWAGMIVGFDNDDASIFEEQYKFLQEAQIPIVMVNALEAVPKTPLYARMKAEGRLLQAAYGSDIINAHFDKDLGKEVGGTNFVPKNMTRKELMDGLSQLYRRLYAPNAFTSRLLGNLSRFKNAQFQPERVQPGYPLVFIRLLVYYWRKGKDARKFFFGNLWTALRTCPRMVGQVLIYMGMYIHFTEVHKGWDPWLDAEAFVESNAVLKLPLRKGA